MARLLGYLFWGMFLGLATMLDYSIAAKNRPTYTFAEHAERRLAEAKALVGKAMENRTAMAEPQSPAAPERSASAPVSVEPGLTPATSAGGAALSLLAKMIAANGKPAPAPEAPADGQANSPAAMAAAATQAFAAISAALSGDTAALPADLAPPLEADAQATDQGVLKPVGRLTDKACVIRAGHRTC